MSRSPVSATTCLRGRCERKSARTAVAGPVGGGRLAQRSQELVPGGEHRAAPARGSVLYDLLLSGLPLVGPVPPLVLVPLRARGVGGASSIRIVTSGDIDGSASYVEWSPDSENPKTSSVDGHNAPWHRRLWSIGTVLGLHEVLEYADACLTGRSPTTEGLRFVVGSNRREVARDPGVGHLAAELDEVLGQMEVNTPKQLSRHAYDHLDQLTRRAQAEYCRRWADATEDVPVEFAARAIASHLRAAGRGRGRRRSPRCGGR